MKNLKFVVSVILLIIFILTRGNGFAQTGNAEHKYLADKAGKWTVIMTLKPAINVAPQVIKGLIAERTMVGDYCLHETMHLATGSKVPYFKRLADLAYNLNELRWDYISIDTRITAGIMYFTFQGKFCRKKGRIIACRRHATCVKHLRRLHLICFLQSLTSNEVRNP